MADTVIIDCGTGQVTERPLTPAEEAALVIPPAVIEAARDSTVAQMDEVEGYIRAFALVMLDEINLHAERINSILTAIDTGATLAQVKTNVAAILDIPPRTGAQLKSAVRSKLGT